MGSHEVGNKKETLGFKVILVLLILTILGLTIGVVFVTINRENSGSHDSFSNYELPESLMGDDLSPEDQVIKETTIMVQNPNISMEEIEGYYDGVISKANEDGDYDFAIKIIIQKVGFLVSEEDGCEKAKNYLDNLDTSMYSKEEIIYLQSYAYSSMWDCEGIGEDE